MGNLLDADFAGFADLFAGLAFAVQTFLDASIYKVGTSVRREHLQHSLL